MENKVFAKGINFKRAEGTPNWIVGKLSIKSDEAIEFIKANSKNGWVNLDIKESYKDKSKFYCELNTWEGTKDKIPYYTKANTTEEANEIDSSSLPF